MLRDEITAMLDIFDEYQIPEDRQRGIISNGVNFDFTYGDPDPSRRNKYLDAFQFAGLLTACKKMSIPLDVNHMLEYSYDSKYEKLLEFVSSMESMPNDVPEKVIK